MSTQQALISPAELHSIKFRIKALYPLIYTILFLTAPIILALLKLNYIAIALLIFLAINWAYRSLITLYGVIVGYILYLRSKNISWKQKLDEIIANWDKLPHPEELPSKWEDFKLAIIIPMYKESYEILKKTFEAIKKSNYDLSHIDIILATEKRAGKTAQETVRKLKKEFKELHILSYTHPDNIPGEVIGIAGPNLRWAAKKYSKYLQQKNISSQNVLMLKFDADTQVTPDFLANLTVRYLLDKHRFQKFYSTATILYANNIWRVHAFSRVFWMLLSFVILAGWHTVKHRSMSFSIYAFNFKTMEDIGFWDPVIGIDDTEFYIQAFLKYKTNFQGQMIYTPVLMDAVEGESLTQTARNLFKQQIRWGAGAIVAPITLFEIWKDQSIPLLKKVQWSLYFIESYSLIPTASYLLSLGMPIILIINNYLTYLIAGHMIPLFLATIMKISTFFAFIVLYIILKLYREYSTDHKPYIIRFTQTFLEFYLVALNSILFSLIPYTIAQFKIVLGKYGKFHVVEKIPK